MKKIAGILLILIFLFLGSCFAFASSAPQNQNAAKPQKAIRVKLLKYLKEYYSKGIPLIDYIREEHKQNAETLKLCLTSEKQINTIYYKRTRDNYHKYGKEIYKQAAPLLDYYYNKLEDAVKRNSEEKIDEYGAEIAAKVLPITASGKSPWDPINLTNEKLRRFIPFYLSKIEKEAIPKIAVWQVGPRLIDYKTLKILLIASHLPLAGSIVKSTALKSPCPFSSGS